MEHLCQPAGTRTCTAVLFAIPCLVLGPHSREKLVQLFIEIRSLAGAQTHPKPGNNVGDTALVRSGHDLCDVFFGVLDKGQYRHHCEPDLNALFGQDLGHSEPSRDNWRARLYFLAQHVVGSRDRKAHRSMHPVDLDQLAHVSEDQIALGENVHRIPKLGNDFQCLSGHVQRGLRRCVWVLHGTGAHCTLDPLAGEFPAQQLDGVHLDQEFAVKVVDLVALAA